MYMTVPRLARAGPCWPALRPRLYLSVDAAFLFDVLLIHVLCLQKFVHLTIQTTETLCIRCYLILKIMSEHGAIEPEHLREPYVV